MKKFLLAAIPAALILSGMSYAADDSSKLIKPKIVGGQEADQGEWPWMSALVVTFDQINTSLTVNNVSYESSPFTGSPSGQVSGALVDCGIGDATCADATEKVCLIERGEINFSEKALNCESGGGVGVVIYNNAEGNINGTLGDDFTGTIPILSITQADGNELKSSFGEIAEINIAEGTSLAQASSCGASFLGGRWVLTAAHCVEDLDISRFKVNVGEFDLSDGANQATSIKRIYMHPEYNDITLNNDIALIELMNNVEAPAISLASKELTDQLAMENSLATVIGWGGREGYGPGEGPTSNFPDVLHEVDLSLLTNFECLDLLGEASVSSQMICATVTGGGKGSCQGDSGGPLVVNTNEGWQQVGVVSWGIGCAAEGYPGVYARAASFDTWIKAINQGIAIEQTADFNIVPVGQSFEQELVVSNNSQETVTLGFSLNDDTYFSLDSSNCDNALAANASCNLTLNLSSDSPVDAKAMVEITSDIETVLTSSAHVKATVIAQSETIETALSNSNADVVWFSGGNQTWLANVVGGVIESGAIDDNQNSIVMATIEGPGELSFDWSVSSEENTEDPTEPFDALYLFVNDEQVDFISGDVAFTSNTITLTEESNRISWVYSKDGGVSELDDKAYLRNVSFATATPAPTPAPTPLPTPTNASSGSSGGSFVWLTLMLAGILRLRK